jgi:ABC-type uncharacterized transport system substrate-binding protein
MLKTLKNVWLGVTLIALTSALLLYSDRDRRQGAARPADKARPRLAVMQWASTDLLDQTVAGIVEGLRRLGFENGRTADIRFFNASGDTSAGNTIARDLADGRYDMVLTASTLALQAVAKANAQGRVVHVFGGVTDPYGAGVAITGSQPDQHPPHLVGVGTFQPVERAIRLARQMNPALRRIGVVWNPGESNSEACIGKARAVCLELGVELLEANAGNTSEVAEAVRSILARGAQALWVGGDTVAISSISGIVAAARAARIPVFTNDPHDISRGVLFGLGASYRQVGIAVGEMGGGILKGTDPRTLGVENLVPEVLAINESVAAEFAASWSIPDDARAKARASAGVDAGVEEGRNLEVRQTHPNGDMSLLPQTARTGRPSRPREIRIIRYNDAQFSADTFRGMMDGLKQQGLEEGRDIRVRCLNAQGDMTTLSSIMTAVRSERPDLVMTISTPTLQAAIRQLGDLPIVFGCVADGVQAGAGASPEDHLPNVTGISTRSPVEAMASLIARSVPGVRAVGTLFSPGEVNAELNRRWFADALAGENLKLVAIPINSSAEAAEATGAMLRSDIQVVAQIMDNSARPAYAQIARRAREAGLAFLCFDSSGLQDGATLSYGRDYHASGVEAAEVAARVLRGTPPAEIPIALTRTVTLAVNPVLARAHGIVLPPDLERMAKIVEDRTP